MAPDARQRRLRARLQRRHLDDQVAARAGAAGEPPAVAQLIGGERARVERSIGDLAGDDPDLALLAGAVAAAGRVDRDRRSSSRRRRSACRSGTRTSAPSGRNRSRTRSAPSPGCASGSIARSRFLAGTPISLRPFLLGSRLARAVRGDPARAPRIVAEQQVAAPHSLDARRRAVDMIALVSPAAIAIGRNAAFSTWRSGRPNETFDAPRHMFTPSSSRIRRIVASVVVTASVSAPTVIASGSITTSCAGIP